MPINTQEELQLAIASLQRKNDVLKEELVEQYKITHESLKPINLIKGAIHGIGIGGGSGSVTTNVVDNAIGLAAGFLSKKILIGGSGNFFNRILGNIIEFGVANVVSKNSEGIKEGGATLFKKFFKAKKD